jgi:hypothetical protein
MRSHPCLSALLALSCAACGARSSLDPGASRDDDGGGAAGAGGAGPGTGTGGGGGTIGPPGCETVTISEPALSEALIEGPYMEGASLTMLGGGDARVCVVGPILEQSFANFYGSVCFEAFGAWPTSLGNISAIGDATNAGIRIAPGVPTGMAALTGQSAGPAASGAQFTPSFEPGTEPDWMVLPGKTAHRATFLTRANDGGFFAGLSLEVLPYLFLELHHLGASTPWAIQPIACAESHVAADAIDADGSVIVATSSGRAFGSCSDDDGIPGPPTRLQVATYAADGTSLLLHDEDLGGPIDDVRVEDAGDSVWVAASIGADLRLRRINKTGGVAWLVDGLGGENLGTAFDLATRGDELLVAYFALGAGSSFEVRVDAFARSGEHTSLGGFDAGDDVYALAIALGTSPENDAAVVAYSTLFSGQVVARRFDCVAD